MVHGEVSCREEDGVVVEQVLAVEEGMDHKVADVPVLVRIGFSLSLRVPLSTTNFEDFIIVEPGDAMSSGEDHSGLYQRSSTDKMIDGGRLDLSSFVTFRTLQPRLPPC